jgi:23S rRNA (uracil1939-C5)-methyltransferase
VLADGLTGLSAARADRPGAVVLAGDPAVEDRLRTGEAAAAPLLRLRRDPRAFFQGNRFLIETLVRRVVALVSSGPVLDLYAGVGLFGLALALGGCDEVTLVEGDPVSGRDLARNAHAMPGVRVEQCAVESHLAGASRYAATVVLDPPRAGMSPGAMADLLRLAPGRIVYVSCDPATLARDARALLAGGYTLGSIEAMDLYPGTAHVEAVAVFDRAHVRGPSAR